MHDVTPAARALVLAVVAWSLGWKGVSLWRAARNDSKGWFAALLLSNTMGVLDAIYLFGVDRRHRMADWDRVDEARLPLEDAVASVDGQHGSGHETRSGAREEDDRAS